MQQRVLWEALLAGVRCALVCCGRHCLSMYRLALAVGMEGAPIAGVVAQQQQLAVKDQAVPPVTRESNGVRKMQHQTFISAHHNPSRILTEVPVASGKGLLRFEPSRVVCATPS